MAPRTLRERIRLAKIGGGEEYDPDLSGLEPEDLNLPKKPIIEQIGEEYDPDLSITEPEPSLDTPKQNVLATSKPTRNLRQMMDELYTPETTSRDRFSRLLESFPERNKPGILRKIVASGASLGNVRRRIPGGIEAAEKVMYAPYLRDLGEWKEKADPYAKAVQLENQANAAERQLAGNILTAQTQAEKLAETERHNRAREESERVRAAAYDFYARTRGVKWDLSGPTIKVMDAQGNIHDTGLSTGKLSEEARISMQNQGRIEAAAQGNRMPVMYNGKPYVLDPNSNMLVPLTIGEEPTEGPVTPITAPRTAARPPVVTPAQRKDAEFVRARELAQDPAFAPYITISEDTYEFGIPGIDWMASKEKKDKGKEILDYIEGRTDKRPSAVATPQQTPMQGQRRGQVPPVPPTPQQRDKAIAFLKQNNMPVTEVNIQHAIATGRVK